MYRIFNPTSSRNMRDAGTLIFRVIIGLLLISHGFPKLQKLLGEEPIQFASVFGISQSTSLFLAMAAEFFCALLVIFGLATRIACIPIIITMAVIVLSIHGDDPLNKKELPLLYLFSYGYVLLTGPGRISLDNLIYKKRSGNR